MTNSSSHWASILTAAVVGPTGHPAEAETLGREGLRLSIEVGYSLVGAWCRYVLAWTALYAGRAAEAHEHMRLVVADRTSDPNPFAEIHHRSTLAVTAAVLGAAAEADAAADAATALARTLRLRGILIMAHVRAATAAVLTGRPGKAADTLRECLTLIRQTGMERWAADALELTALVLHDTGKLGALPKLLSTATELRERSGELPGSGIPCLRTALTRIHPNSEAAPARLEDTLTLALNELDATRAGRMTT